jgi:hypothetical protein
VRPFGESFNGTPVVVLLESHVVKPVVDIVASANMKKGALKRITRRKAESATKVRRDISPILEITCEADVLLWKARPILLCIGWLADGSIWVGQARTRCPVC